MNCAVVDISTWAVVNIIVADPAIDKPLEGCLLVALGPDTPCDIGWGYDQTTDLFVDPNPVAP